MLKRSFFASSLLILAVALPAAGCGGDGNDDGTVPSVSGVFPQEVFLGRSTEVLISGSGTNWTEGVQVDFGAGVTVDDVVVSSPSALYVTLTVDPGAEMGGRDVTVTGAEVSTTLSGAFAVNTPLELASVQGSAAQGSIVLVTVKNKDLLNPFDTTSTGGGLFEPPSFPNVSVDTPDGYEAQVANVSLYQAELTLLVDVNAESGPLDLNVFSGPAEDTKQFLLPAAFEIQSREPTPLTLGTPVSGDVNKPFDSALYKLEPSTLSIVDLGVLADSSDASPSFVLLGPSGSFSDFRSQGAAASFASDEAFHLIYFDGSGTAGYQFTLESSSIEAGTMDETEPNNDETEAQNGAAPIVFQSAELSSSSDEDWIVVNADSDDVGKSLRVFTQGGNALTDTQLEILFDSEGSLVSLGQSEDNNYHDALEAVIDEQGTYYVKVFASSFFNPAAKTYEAAVYLVE